jgi:hypothetical protein
MTLLAEITKFKRNRRSILFIAIALLFSVIFVMLLFNKTSRVQDPQQILLQKHQETLRKSPSSIETEWLKTLNPLVKKTEGRIVWDTATQQGVMTFINLPKPKEGEHYHVWLYDLKRRQQEPVSGGAFFTSGEKNVEYWVALTPQTKVIEPYKFIVLLEADNRPTTAIEEPQILLLAQP